jgi:glutamine synthetase type III
MTLSSILTIITDALIAITLIYCIVLERRIRAFRKQEQTFRTLIKDVSESTREAQGAVSSLRRMLDEFGHRTTTEKSKAADHTVLPAPVFSKAAQDHLKASLAGSGGARSIGFSAYDNPVSALAARVAALQNKQAVG